MRELAEKRTQLLQRQAHAKTENKRREQQQQALLERTRHGDPRGPRQCVIDERGDAKCSADISKSMQPLTSTDVSLHVSALRQSLPWHTIRHPFKTTHFSTCQAPQTTIRYRLVTTDRFERTCPGLHVPLHERIYFCVVDA